MLKCITSQMYTLDKLISKKIYSCGVFQPTYIGKQHLDDDKGTRGLPNISYPGKQYTTNINKQQYWTKKKPTIFTLISIAIYWTWFQNVHWICNEIINTGYFEHSHVAVSVLHTWNIKLFLDMSITLLSRKLAIRISKCRKHIRNNPLQEFLVVVNI